MRGGPFCWTTTRARGLYTEPMARRHKPWKRPKDLPKGEIWPPDQGLHPISESWKEEVRRGYPTSRSVSGEVLKWPAKPTQNGPVKRQP